MFSEANGDILVAHVALINYAWIMKQTLQAGA
jgi:hypothetical protein